MNHLTERELIEYQFKLTSEPQMEKVDEHLRGCGQCRAHLEKLRQKFAALDLLREEPAISEELISQVVKQARQPAPRKVVSFRRPAWVGAAAAVFLIGLLVVALQLSRDKVPAPQPVEEPSRPVAEMKPEEVPEVTQAAALGDKDVAKVKPHLALTTRKQKVVADESERAPFAPASAIELVTLPRRENVQITIYNSADLTLVRERRNLTLKKGWNWLQFMWANTLIDPTSLNLEPLEHADKIDIQQLVFPARLRELGRWLIRSEVGGQVPFEITYFTSGLGWRAFYMGTLTEDEKKMRLQGYVRVSNRSGEDYENAQTRLIVGKVHILEEIAELAKRRYPYDTPARIGISGYGGGAREMALGLRWDEGKSALLRDDAALVWSGLTRKEIKKEGLSEYFLYTIEGTETIPHKWGKRLLSFNVKDIAVKSLYKYDEERWGRQVIRFVAFENDEEHNLGKTPIPNGTVKIYSQADEQGHLSYIGGTDIKYIPVDEEVELSLGSARLVRVEPALMDFETENYMFNRKKNIAGWDEIRTWKIEVTNARQLPVEVEITRGFGTAYWTLQADNNEVSYEKHDATHARFKLMLQPRSKRTFGYTVTTYHGVREKAITE